MVSELFFILTPVLRVTPVVFTFGEGKSLHILFISIGTAVHALTFPSMCTYSFPHPLRYNLTVRLSSLITTYLTTTYKQCVILILQKLVKAWNFSHRSGEDSFKFYVPGCGIYTDL